MTSQTLPVPPARRRVYVRFTLALVRTIVARVASGESVAAICREPLMPSRNTVTKWAKRPAIGRELAAARAAAGRIGMGRGGAPRKYCPATAEEIFTRVAEGESLTSICADPAMPHATTVARWRRYEPAFDAAMRVAREAQAERLCDEGLELARTMTPQTAYQTHVALTHLRWLTAALAPELFGRVKPMAAPEKPRESAVAIRRFEVQVRPEDGWTRFVSYVGDRGSGEVVMDSAGEWRPPPREVSLERPTGGEVRIPAG